MERSEQLAAKVTPEQKRRFRIEAAKRDMDMSELLRHIVDEFLEEQETESGNPTAVQPAD